MVELKIVVAFSVVGGKYWNLDEIIALTQPSVLPKSIKFIQMVI